MRTGGPIRGFLGRWLVRFEASKQIISAVFLGVTAASTLTTALTSIGYQHLAPYLLGLGMIGLPAFAYGFVDLGIFNRKNRERVDRGDNFVGPGFAMNMTLQAEQLSALAEAMADEESDPEEIREKIQSRTADRLREYRDGIDVEEVYGATENGTKEKAR